MKKNILLLMLLLVSGIAVIHADQSSSNQSNPDQCYCSYVCEFRDREDDDTPFVCQDTGVCFCKQRDKDKYFEHGCDKKNNSFSEQTSCSMGNGISKN